jgi:hypothetical protein
MPRKRSGTKKETLHTTTWPLASRFKVRFLDRDDPGDWVTILSSIGGLLSVVVAGYFVFRSPPNLDPRISLITSAVIAVVAALVIFAVAAVLILLICIGLQYLTYGVLLGLDRLRPVYNKNKTMAVSIALFGIILAGGAFFVAYRVITDLIPILVDKMGPQDVTKLLDRFAQLLEVSRHRK